MASIPPSQVSQDQIEQLQGDSLRREFLEQNLKARNLFEENQKLKTAFQGVRQTVSVFTREKNAEIAQLTEQRNVLLFQNNTDALLKTVDNTQAQLNQLRMQHQKLQNEYEEAKTKTDQALNALKEANDVLTKTSLNNGYFANLARQYHQGPLTPPHPECWVDTPGALAGLLADLAQVATTQSGRTASANLQAQSSSRSDGEDVSPKSQPKTLLQQQRHEANPGSAPPPNQAMNSRSTAGNSGLQYSPQPPPSPFNVSQTFPVHIQALNTPQPAQSSPPMQQNTFRGLQQVRGQQMMRAPTLTPLRQSSSVDSGLHHTTLQSSSPAQQPQSLFSEMPRQLDALQQRQQHEYNMQQLAKQKAAQQQYQREQWAVQQWRQQQQQQQQQQQWFQQQQAGPSAQQGMMGMMTSGGNGMPAWQAQMPGQQGDDDVRGDPMDGA